MDAPCIVIRPNASLNTRQALSLLIGMCTLSFTIAGILAAMGYWMILPFAGLEMGCLAAALHVAMQANREREILRIDGDQLVLERGRDTPRYHREFPLHWVQVKLQPAAGPTDVPRVQLRYAGQHEEVGRVLAEEERAAFARHLTSWVAQARKQATAPG